MSFQARAFNIYLDYQSRMLKGQAQLFVRNLQKAVNENVIYQFTDDPRHAQVSITIQVVSEGQLTINIKNSVTNSFYLAQLNFRSLSADIRVLGLSHETSVKLSRQKEIIQKILFLAAKRAGALINS